MGKKVYISFIYEVNNKVFNVGENGTKTRWSPTANKRYVYASPQNIKHNVKERFVELSEREIPTVIFEKIPVWEGDQLKEKQGGVSTSIDITNPNPVIFGAWNATKSKYVDDYATGGKYDKAALTSAITFTEFAPLHPYLAEINRSEKSVHCGGDNSMIAVVSDKKGGNGKRYFTADEFANGEGIDLEKAIDFFKNTRTMNLFEELESANGIYRFDAHIDLEKFGSVCLSENNFDEGMVQEVINGGGYKKMIGKKEYLFYSDEGRLFLYDMLVRSLFEFEFSSNESLHGAKPKLLRVQFTVDDPAVWQQCTRAKITGDGKAVMCLIDNAEKVYTYNTLNIESVPFDGEINTPSLNAHKDAQAKLYEIGANFFLK